jgi:hypothetical protein
MSPKGMQPTHLFLTYQFSFFADPFEKLATLTPKTTVECSYFRHKGKLISLKRYWLPRPFSIHPAKEKCQTFHF